MTDKPYLLFLDSSGHLFVARGPAELCRRLNAPKGSARRAYVDREGVPYHCGYVVQGRRFTAYQRHEAPA